MTHVPVLLHEAVAALDIKPQGVYVDGTMAAAAQPCHCAAFDDGAPHLH